MPYPTDITYPAKATDGAWQKKKSTLDKVHKTGVGPKLIAAEKAWKAIPFNALNDAQNQPKTSQEAKQAWDGAVAAALKVAAAETALGEAIKTVKAQVANKKLSSDSRKALGVIQTDLEGAAKRLDLMDDLPGMFEIDHRNIVKEEAEAANELTNVTLRSGNTVIGEARKAKKQQNGILLVEQLEWEAIADVGLKYLQKEVTVMGTNKLRKPFQQKMKLVSVSSKFAKLE